MDEIMQTILKIMFTVLLAVAAVFYFIFAFKHKETKKRWLEIAIWGIIFVSEIAGFMWEPAWRYILGIVALAMVINKMVSLSKK